jgi:GH15 family glucan-1,4-alpha-glucosidase
MQLPRGHDCAAQRGDAAACYQPTGAILAAGTSSLPEEIGGLRNWDYRYCWLRDAAMSAQALVMLGSGDEADALLAWTLRIINGTAGHPERLHPLYTVDGFELGAEAVIETLPGYAGSRPVRVGNPRTARSNSTSSARSPT